MKVGIILCDPYRSCAGGKRFHSVRERTGGFATHRGAEPLEAVGYTTYEGWSG